jgi:hypothetical protein
MPVVHYSSKFFKIQTVCLLLTSFSNLFFTFSHLLSLTSSSQEILQDGYSVIVIHEYLETHLVNLVPSNFNVIPSLAINL